MAAVSHREDKGLRRASRFYAYGGIGVAVGIMQDNSFAQSAAGKIKDIFNETGHTVGAVLDDRGLVKYVFFC